MTAAVLALDPHVAAHLAAALREHQRAMRGMGITVPAELEELARLCFQVHGGQGGSNSTQVDQSGKPVGMNSRLRTYSGAAEFLAVSESSIKRLVAAGELRPVTIAGAVRFRVADLEAYVADLQPRAEPSPAA